MVTATGARDAPPIQSQSLTPGEVRQRYSLDAMTHAQRVAWLEKHGDRIAAVGRRLQ